jgi:hypothetical protein
MKATRNPGEGDMTPVWECDFETCGATTDLDAYGKPEDRGWWEVRGVHLCPMHHPMS